MPDEVKELREQLAAALRERDTAHAAAIQAAAEHQEIQVLGDPNTAVEWYGACSCGKLRADGKTPWATLWRDHILSFTPAASQLLYDLRIAEAVRDEAKAWDQAAIERWGDQYIDWAKERLASADAEVKRLQSQGLNTKGESA